MEAVSYLPGAVQESRRKGGNQINNYKPILYASSYLVALQEESDFNRLQKILNRIELPAEIEEHYQFMKEHYSVIGDLISFIKEREKVELDTITKKLDLSEEKARKLLKLAGEINIVYKEGQEVYSCREIPSLKKVMKKSDKDNSGFFKKIKSIFS